MSSRLIVLSFVVVGSGTSDKDGEDAGDVMECLLETYRFRQEPLHVSPLFKHLLHEG
jgi:hypothetical protein